MRSGTPTRTSRAGAASLLGALVLLAIATGAVAGERRASACIASARLNGTFVQLTRASAEWPRADWERLFADMAAVGIEQVFVQWTWADGVAFYPGEAAGSEQAPMLDLLFELAGRHRMRLWLGLAHDAGWWAGIDRGRPPSGVEVFLARRRLQNVAVARALAPQVVARDAFAGWYVPDEIDDKNWLGEERARLLVDYLADLGGELAALAPGAPIAVSTFAQGWATPEQFVALWRAILARAPISLLLFQDGIGVEKLTLDEEAIYLPLLRALTDADGKQLGIVIELFEEAVSGPGGAPTPQTVPAALERIERQLALAERWASGPRVGFSVPDHMSALAGARAADLFEAYQRWVARCAPASPAQ